MMQIVSGIITLILLILSRVFKANDAQAAKQEAIIKELKDAIPKGDTSAITAALSGLR